MTQESVELSATREKNKTSLELLPPLSQLCHYIGALHLVSFATCMIRVLQGAVLSDVTKLVSKHLTSDCTLNKIDDMIIAGGDN